MKEHKYHPSYYTCEQCSMTKSFTQKKLEEFDEGCNIDNISDPPSDKTWLKAFLSESIEQAREEERERIKKLIEKSSVRFQDEGFGRLTWYVKKDDILSSLNNQDK